MKASYITRKIQEALLVEKVEVTDLTGRFVSKGLDKPKPNYHIETGYDAVAEKVIKYANFNPANKDIFATINTLSKKTLGVWVVKRNDAVFVSKFGPFMMTFSTGFSNVEVTVFVPTSGADKKVMSNDVDKIANFVKQLQQVL